MKPIFLFTGILFSFAVNGQDTSRIKEWWHTWEKDMVQVPAQNIVNPTCNDSVLYPGLPADTIQVESFYISRVEVSNNDYRQFLNYLIIVDDDSLARAENYPDTTVWDQLFVYSYSDPITNMYFWHPAYDNYPVVGLTYEQCQAYCRWATKIYNSNPRRKYQKVEFSLPSHKQFMAAALGGKPARLFAFEGDNWMDKKKGPKMNLNHARPFKIMQEKDACRPTFKQSEVAYNDGAVETTKVISYFPNEYGIYNLSGNVEEFLQEYGCVKGGGWNDVLREATLLTAKKYTRENEKSPQRGFRFVMKIIEQ